MFSLFQSAAFSEKSKHKHTEEDEYTIREFEDGVLMRVTQKPPPPPPPPKAPPRNNANANFFTSMKTFENTAMNMLSGFMAANQIESLPEAVRNFVAIHPGFIRNLMSDHGLIAQHLFLLNDNELMLLHKYRENLERLLDSGISMQQLLSLDGTARSIFIYNADAIVSLMKQGNTFEQLSTLSNNDLMNCVQESRASEASQSSAASASGPS